MSNHSFGQKGLLVWRSRRIALRMDPWLVSVLAFFFVLTSLYLLPFVPRETLAYFTDYFLDLSIQIIIVISIVSTKGFFNARRETLFWRFILAAYCTWMLLRISYLTPAITLSQDLGSDYVYFFFYCCILLGLESRIRPIGLSPLSRARYVLNAFANLLFAVCMFTYFVLIPAYYAPDSYQTWLPSFLCYLALDVYIGIRFAVIGRSTRSPRWRAIFYLLSLTAFLWAAGDIVEGWGTTSGYIFLTGKATDLWWVVAYLPVILATRMVALGPDKDSDLVGQFRKGGQLSDRLLVINALIPPVVHLVAFMTGLFENPATLERHLFIFVWMLFMSLLLLVQYSLVNRRNRVLERLRQRNVRILEAISRVQSQFIAAASSTNVFDNMLEQLLRLSDSEYGFVGEIQRTNEGRPFLRILGMAHLSRTVSQRFYGNHQEDGEEIYDLDTLFGAAITTGSPVISNDPSNDPRRAGFPEGTPMPHAYLGIPLYHRDKLIGMFGVANRSTGYNKDLLKYLEPFSSTCGGIISAYHNDRERERMGALATRFGRILDDSLQEIYLFDAEHLRFLQVNRGARENVGYTESELRNLGPEDLYPSDSHLHFREIISKMLTSSQKNEKVQFTATHRRKNGSSYPVDVYLQLSNFDGSKVFVAIVLDITERRRMEREKARLESQVIQSQKLETIGTLAGGIAHDFNNILAPIIWYTEMIVNDDDNDPEIREDLRHVLKAANRAKDLVQQILTFGRMREVERSPVQIQLVIEEAIKLVRASLPATIEITCQVNNKCDPVLADPTQIHQVVMNLCTNAYHAMREDGGVLDVTLGHYQVSEEEAAVHGKMQPGKWVKLTVADTGHGMDPATMDRIFEPFFTTKNVDEGTGLGLSVIHGIVMTYGGHITVSSKPGQGSAFNIFLPPVDYEKQLVEKWERKVADGHERILFVDDEEEIVRTGKLMLERFGYKVTATTDSRQALELFTDAPEYYDLVITDQTMPGLTGLRLAAELKKIRPDIKIVLSTGFSEEASEERWREVGIDRFVMKPVVGSDLHRLIRNVLDEDATPNPS